MDLYGLEILLDILAFVTNAYLGLFVYLRNPKSATHRLFAILSLLTCVYVVVNYISLHPEIVGAHDQLFWIRIVMMTCSFIGPALIFLVHTFPRDEFTMKPRYVVGLLTLMTASALLSYFPFVFTDLQFPEGKPVPTPGPGIPVFFIDFVGLFIASFIMLWYKLHHTIGEERARLRIFFLGIVSTFSMMGLTTVISVVVLKSSALVFLGPVSSGILLAAVAYAIIKYRMFNIKLAATQAFVITISIVSLAKIFTSADTSARFIDLIIFITTVLFGLLLVRSVDEEIRSREQIQDLAKRLADTNWELAKTNEQLRLIDQRKSEFVSIVSHQLRTPIAAVKGYASLLLEGAFGDLTERQKESVDRIFISAGRLAQMITDFLDISKIEQGTMTYTFTAVDLRTIVKDLVEDFQTVTKARGLTLDAEIPEGETFTVTADEGKIRQILSNLIDNAIKYTLKGSIHILLEKDNVAGTVFIKVHDTGVGLTQNDIHHLFSKFTRGAGSEKLSTDGSGLGLYVAKKMLEAHRGKIWVDSAGPGTGSTFVVELLAEEI